MYFVSKNDFNNFMEDYADFRKLCIEPDEFKMIKTDMLSVQSITDNFMTKETFVNRITVLHNDLVKKINERSLKTDVTQV